MTPVLKGSVAGGSTARKLVIPRKGGPGRTGIGAPTTEDDPTDANTSRTPDSREADADLGSLVVCPNCGCEFDPTDADTPMDGDAPTDANANGKAQPRGAVLPLESGPMDPQAPIGTDAVTAALASVLGNGRA